MSPLTLLRGGSERASRLAPRAHIPEIARAEHSYLLLAWDRQLESELYLHGQAWSGRGAAGKLAHTLVKKDGAACACGRRGCLSAYSSGLAMEERLHKLRTWGRQSSLSVGASPKQWLEAIHAGDELAHEVLTLSVESMLSALDSVSRLLDLEAIVLDGCWGRALAGSAWLKRSAASSLPPLLLNRYDDGLR